MPAPTDNSGPVLAKSPAGDNAPPLSVTELSAALKRTVEDRFGHVRLRGEISGFKRAASGHVYLALKDDKAVIDGVIWRGNAGRLGFAPEDGLDVVATGKITTYAGRSKYQIVIDRLELAGEGALMQLFEKLKARLGEEGLFASERKQPLPFLPRTIGVVTSPTGSVIRDILHRLADRFPSHVLVWPVLVQGEGAAEQIAAAIRGFSDMAEGDEIPRPDLVIVARGGGSIEDLWSFNEEVVVRAIADCTIPLISAVGHETDTTLADYAADQRAPTPTAAAEMAVPVRAEIAAQLNELGLRAGRAVRRQQALATERLEQRARLLPRPEALFAPAAQRLDDQGERLGRALGFSHQRASDRLHGISGRLSQDMLTRRTENAARDLARVPLRPALVTAPLQRSAERLAALERLLAQCHPDAPLQRGYAKVTNRKGAIVASGEAAKAAGEVSLHFADEAVAARIEGAATAVKTPPVAPAKKPVRRKPSAQNADQPKLL
ncbi:MAG: exodeoxyribonuclease VII large subunit [Pseudomonadota bacterium]